jgi:hypothetical protein
VIKKAELENLPSIFRKKVDIHRLWLCGAACLDPDVTAGAKKMESFVTAYAISGLRAQLRHGRLA